MFLNPYNHLNSSSVGLTSSGLFNHYALMHTLLSFSICPRKDNILTNTFKWQMKINSINETPHFLFWCYGNFYGKLIFKSLMMFNSRRVSPSFFCLSIHLNLSFANCSLVCLQCTELTICVAVYSRQPKNKKRV